MEDNPTDEMVEMELNYGMKDGEVRDAISDQSTRDLKLEGLPIEVYINNIDEVLKNNEDFALARKNGLGGSDSAAVLGVSPYTSRQQLIHKKFTSQDEYHTLHIKECLVEFTHLILHIDMLVTLSTQICKLYLNIYIVMQVEIDKVSQNYYLGLE